MTPTETAKIGRFLEDKTMSGAVKSVLLRTFLKKRSATVSELAAERLAITLLEEAWIELERMQTAKAEDTKSGPNVGL